MATTVRVMSGQKCVCYSPEYRADALSLAERVGVAAAPPWPVFVCRVYLSIDEQRRRMTDA